MIKAKTFKTPEGKYVVKVRFLFFWWRAVDVEVLVIHPNNRVVVPKYTMKFIPENKANHFSSEYAASFFLKEIKSLL
jgi:hypothetical protein